MNIILIGPMGTGKTTIGLEAARILGKEFVDTDQIVEQMSGSSINELFTQRGEMHFREIEKQAIKTLADKENHIIATGGGAVLAPENMRLLRSNGIIVALDASAEIIIERLENNNDRPLLRTMDDLEEYLAQRAPYYSNSDFKIDTGIMNIEASVDKLCHIAKIHFVRICGCISGANAKADIQTAARNGVSMIELRLDLIPEPDIENLIQSSPVPVIATDRENKHQLKQAILAGCNFVDIEIDSPEKGEIMQMAREAGCKVIVSYHDFESVPEIFPEIGDADLLKIAVKVNSEDDLNRLKKLHSQHDKIIIVGMGKIGIPLRILGPLLGSYLTYCYIGKPVAEGQLGLLSMIELYREMGLR